MMRVSTILLCTQIELVPHAYNSMDHDDEESRRPISGSTSNLTGGAAASGHGAPAAHGGGGGHGHGHGEFDFGEVRLLCIILPQI